MSYSLLLLSLSFAVSPAVLVDVKAKQVVRKALGISIYNGGWKIECIIDLLHEVWVWIIEEISPHPLSEDGILLSEEERKQTGCLNWHLFLLHVYISARENSLSQMCFTYFAPWWLVTHFFPLFLSLPFSSSTNAYVPSAGCYRWMQSDSNRAGGVKNGSC